MNKYLVDVTVSVIATDQESAWQAVQEAAVKRPKDGIMIEHVHEPCLVSFDGEPQPCL